MRRMNFWLTLILLLSVMMGCSSLKQASSAPGEPAKHRLTADQKKQLQASTLKRRVTALLEKRNYHRAMEIMSAKSTPGFPVKGLDKEYIHAVNGLIELGDEFFSRGDYSIAGRYFKRALDSYPMEPALREKIRYGNKQLKANIDICCGKLMEHGLLEYRRGNLESAIGKWKGLLAINPGHNDARKAVETATTQLHALRKIEKR